MTKFEKFMSELDKLKTPENEKVVGKLMEGVTLIADEYRRRKASEKQAALEAAGFAKLDIQRKASGLSTKAFVEGVGKTVLESAHPDEIKAKMLESLSKYAKYLTESAGVSGCIYYLEPMDDEAKELIIRKDIHGLLQKVIRPNAIHKYGDAATARQAGVEKVAADNGTPIDGTQYTITRKLIDSPHEKLYILSATDGNKFPHIMYYADTPAAPAPAAPAPSTTDTPAATESIGSWIKDKANAVSRKYGSTFGGKNYYDDPETQAKLMDEIYKSIKSASFNKFSKQNDFEIEKNGDTELKGNIICDATTKIPFALAVGQSNDGTTLTLSYQLPGQPVRGNKYNLTPDVKPYMAAHQICQKLRAMVKDRIFNSSKSPNT